MHIKWIDLEIGDEIIVPAKNNLRYLKVIERHKKQVNCSSYDTTVEVDPWRRITLQSDISLHDKVFPLLEEKNTRDIWLVKREKK